MTEIIKKDSKWTRNERGQGPKGEVITVIHVLNDDIIFNKNRSLKAERFLKKFTKIQDKGDICYTREWINGTT